MASGDDLERRLDEWGESATPPVDGAFANRLEVSLRQEMIAEPVSVRGGWLGQLLRPGVVVVAAAVMIAGFALASRPSGDGGLADDAVPLPETTTTDEPATTTSAALSDVAPTTVPAVTDVLPVPTTTAEQIGDPTSSSSPPRTGTTLPPGVTRAPSGPTLPPRPPEPGLDPDDLTTTIPGPTTTIAPGTITELSAVRDGRQLTVSWRFDLAVVDVTGWVLRRESDGEVLELSRDPATRRFVTPISDVDGAYRLQGLDADGDVVVDSGVVLFNPDE